MAGGLVMAPLGCMALYTVYQILMGRAPTLDKQLGFLGIAFFALGTGAVIFS